MKKKKNPRRSLDEYFGDSNREQLPTATASNLLKAKDAPMALLYLKRRKAMDLIETLDIEEC